MDNKGKIQIQMKGTSQEGSTRPILKSPPLISSTNSPNNINESSSTHHSPEPLNESSSSSSSSSSPLPSLQPEEPQRPAHVGKAVQLPAFASEKLRNVGMKPSIRLFTPQEIAFATKNFSHVMLIGEGARFKMYSAKLEDGQFVAVKVQTKQFSSEDLLREIEVLAGLKHENIVKIVGCCNREEIRAVVYNRLKGNLTQHLKKLKWTDRVKVAIGVAKALKYLHHSCNPPIIHRNIKSSNILLSDQCQPQLSDFGEAMVLQEVQEDLTQVDIGRYGYLAPEYLMFGKVNEKVDVYSYGVVLLELITGKHAIQTDQTNRRSLVFWARSLLGCNLAEHLIDPYLKEDYNHELMEMMMIVARLCLLHSSSRRPTMETVKKFFPF